MIILRSQKLLLKIVTYSIYSEVLSQKTGFWVYGRKFAAFTYKCAAEGVLVQREKEFSRLC